MFGDSSATIILRFFVFFSIAKLYLQTFDVVQNRIALMRIAKKDLKRIYLAGLSKQPLLTQKRL